MYTHSKLLLAACSVLAVCSACSRSKPPKGCAEVHFTFDTSSADMLYIGVLGDKQISDSRCFQLQEEDIGVQVTTDKDSAANLWTNVASYTGQPVAESFNVSVLPGNYTLFVPESWTESNSANRIAFSTTAMTHSVGIGPESFKGDKPPRVYLTVRSP